MKRKDGHLDRILRLEKSASVPKRTVTFLTVYLSGSQRTVCLLQLLVFGDWSDGRDCGVPADHDVHHRWGALDAADAEDGVCSHAQVSTIVLTGTGHFIISYRYGRE